MNTQFQIPVNDNIHLSALTPEDKPALVEYLNEREIYERTLRIPFPYTEAEADYFLKIDSEATTRHGHPVHFAIRDPSEKAIGGFGFEGLTYGHRAEIGYWLAKPYRGNGIMTEVVGAICEFAFDNWKLVRITAHVFTSTMPRPEFWRKMDLCWRACCESIIERTDNFSMQSCLRW